MKTMKNIWIVLLAITVSVNATACEYDDDFREINFFEKNHPAVMQALQARYPGAKVVDADFDDGYAELEIIDNRTRRDVWITIDGVWKRTQTDLRSWDLPTVIREAIDASAYAAYRIDDVDYIETPDQAFYQIEFEKNNRPDGSLRISPTGQVL